MLVNLLRLLLVAALIFAWAWAASAASDKKGPPSKPLSRANAELAPVPLSVSYPWAFTEEWRLKEFYNTGRWPTRPSKDAETPPVPNSDYNHLDPNLR